MSACVFCNVCFVCVLTAAVQSCVLVATLTGITRLSLLILSTCALIFMRVQKSRSSNGYFYHLFFQVITAKACGGLATRARWCASARHWHRTRAPRRYACNKTPLNRVQYLYPFHLCAADGVRACCDSIVECINGLCLS